MISQQNLKTIRGYIISRPKNSGGDDAGIALQDEGGEEFLIIPRGMGLDLADYINAKIEISGLVREQDECKSIQVRRYVLQDEYEDQWYDDGK
ncbi:MAG: hypothetical protein LBM00_07165 [Deltaproteobacteria bacterium]|jgi:hypothetical protein|nr:hypothetical protein [Deltaproteobacteria bacterium]